MAGGKCEECEKKGGLLQRRSNGHSEPSDVPPIVYEALSSAGQPLDAGTQAFFEPRFRHDFSGVRVHTDAKASRSALAMNALAYTVGRNVVFRAGQYAPSSAEGRRLIAHELTHVVQQGHQSNLQFSNLQVGNPGSLFERQAEKVSDTVAHNKQVNPIDRLAEPIVQRDLARPPSGPPDPVQQLTEAEIQDAIQFNQTRFRDPYSIRVLRDVMGLTPTPAVVDEEFVLEVVQWQAERRLTQDGQIGHGTTRSFYVELVGEGELRDAILLLMDSYALPESRRLHNIRIGTAVNCCGPGAGADAVTSGGMGGGDPIEVCFCRPRIPAGSAGYNHFIRIIGHELTHVPQRAAAIPSQAAREFEAFFFEACAEGRAPRLAPAERVNHANIALGHFAAIPPALRTPGRIRMRDQLNALIAAGGVGPC
ncbi:MAG: DUF4157 domain-containing protein [Blastocatellia bacterium]